MWIVWVNCSWCLWLLCVNHCGNPSNQFTHHVFLEKSNSSSIWNYKKYGCGCDTWVVQQSQLWSDGYCVTNLVHSVAGCDYDEGFGRQSWQRYRREVLQEFEDYEEEEYLDSDWNIRPFRVSSYSCLWGCLLCVAGMSTEYVRVCILCFVGSL